MRRFHQEFKTLGYIILRSERVLLVAHSRPDADSVGATLALAEYIATLGKSVDIACFDPFPETLKPLLSGMFLHPEQLRLDSYDAVIAADSVDRGYEKIASHLTERQATVLVDHHHDITQTGDVVIIDPEYSSTSELVYLFLVSQNAPLSKSMATALLCGILFDTGGFQHANVTPQVMDIASDLMRRGAPLAKISQTIFAHKNIAALKLWGRAFEKARFNPRNGMLVTAITQKDIRECEASPEDIYQVTSILSTVPDAKFAMVLSEREGGAVRASLRSMEQHRIDVSAIAHQFGGGGHKLASGFEIKGHIKETKEGWQVV